jgi:hypothetical protein
MPQRLVEDYVDEFERLRALIEERWEEGPGRDIALRAVEELIAESSPTEGEEEVE